MNTPYIPQQLRPARWRRLLPAALALAAALVASGPAVAQNIRATAAGAKVVGTGGADVMVAHQGGSRLFGLAGDDKMIGQHGRDQLYAGPGDDLVHGGHGNDVLSGGPGADTFRLFDNDGANRILDFEDGDRLLIQKPAAVLYGYYSDSGFVVRNGRTTADVRTRGGDSTSVTSLALFGNIHGHDYLSLPVFTTGKGYREGFLSEPLTAAEQFDQGSCSPLVIGVEDIGETLAPVDKSCFEAIDFGPLTTGANRVLIEPAFGTSVYCLYYCIPGHVASNVWRVTKTAAGVVTKVDAKPVRIEGLVVESLHFHRMRVHTEALVDLAAARRVKVQSDKALADFYEQGCMGDCMDLVAGR